MKRSDERQQPAFLRIQPYLLAYGAAISVFSPYASAHQLCKLYRKPVPAREKLRASMLIFPHQTMLKTLQMNLCTPVKEHLNPWAAFAVVGILQGVVYGQANVHLTQTFQLVRKVPTLSLAAVFRGSIFAAGRDTISQGAPFVLSSSVRATFFDPLLPADALPGGVACKAAHWGSIMTTSIAATGASQGLHNAQITMQSDPSLTHATALRSLWTKNGLGMMLRGAEARVGLLLVVNLLNELLLKPAWESLDEPRTV